MGKSTRMALVHLVKEPDAGECPKEPCGQLRNFKLESAGASVTPVMSFYNCPVSDMRCSACSIYERIDTAECNKHKCKTYDKCPACFQCTECQMGAKKLPILHSDGSQDNAQVC